jgi:thiamine-phosphate pyrophosphorylase
LKPPSDWRLYGILDLGYVDPPNAASMARKMIDGGIDVLQLRAKKIAPADLIPIAQEIRSIAAESDVPLIVNDSEFLAREIGADGLHLGQEDSPLAEARRPGFILGKSTHSLAQATAAEREGADYIGFGPIFRTPTKPDYAPVGLVDIEEVHRAVTVPIFCIGGIKLENLASVLDAGARRVVIVSGILQALDPAMYAQRAKSMLLENPESQI